jgi:acyl-CoA synthetase (NDP forming)
MSSLTTVHPTLDPQSPSPGGGLQPPGSLRPFFHPRSVAVVGASERPGSIGARLFRALRQGGYRGRLYPVNRRATAVAGLPAYRCVRDVPDAVDLAIVVTPRDAVLGVVEECAACGVRAVLVVTAGFAETGAAGEELQGKMRAVARAAGMRLLGPNSVGLIAADPRVSLHATLVPLFPPSGPVAICADSGAVELVLVDELVRRGIGVSCCAAPGNRADVSSTDLLHYLEHDEATLAVVLHLEAFGRAGEAARDFLEAARRVSRRKPVVALKAGRTRAGTRAAGSHTAALAARDAVVDAVFHQAGILRVVRLEEVAGLTAGLTMQPLPRGRRVGVLTNAGGLGVLCADACEAGGLVLPELSDYTREELSTFLPGTASLRNPVDMIASATAADYRRAVAVLLGSGEIDSLIVLCTCAEEGMGPAVEEAVGAAVAQARAGHLSLPVLACVMAGADGQPWLSAGPERVPCLRYPEAAGAVLARMTAYAEWRKEEPGSLPSFDAADAAKARDICRRFGGDELGWLPTQQARELLEAAGLKVVPGRVAATANEAVALARRLGFPVAVKLASHRVLHKTERGYVHLNLPAEDAVRAAFEAIGDQLSREWSLDAMEGALVQPMVPGATEVLIGMTNDPLFGPVFAFGLGGIHVELLGDVCLRVGPLTDPDAREMVRSIRCLPLLLGHRGRPAADVVALEEALLRLSWLVEKVPEVVEVDLNPVFALPEGQGCLIADARVRVGKPHGLHPREVTP